MIILYLLAFRGSTSIPLDGNITILLFKHYSFPDISRMQQQNAVCWRRGCIPSKPIYDGSNAEKSQPNNKNHSARTGSKSTLKRKSIPFSVESYLLRFVIDIQNSPLQSRLQIKIYTVVNQCNRTNMPGMAVVSRVYIYSLNGSSFVITSKMLMLK